MTFRARNLSVRYGHEKGRALDRVDMTVPEGSLYAVIGPNGSGKSTLMRALLGLVRAESGTVHVGGRETGRWSRRDLAKEVGAVPQGEHMMFPLPVRDVVAMGRYPHLGSLRSERAEDRLAIERAMSRCDVLGLGKRDVTTLSGGEIQRVRIARALAQEPRALALDEPTASLDIRHEMTIFRLLRESAQRGMTVLLITHHINLAARFADRFLLLSGGRVAAEGGPKEVFRASVLAEVYGWPVKVWEDPETGAPQITPGQDPSDSRTIAR
jgi:iron complex transport system ATP-binding protein